MKQLLICLAAGILLPTSAYAAYDDVSVTADANLSVNSIQVNINGSAATVESLTVDTTSFTAVLQSGSYINVSPGSNKQMSYDVTYDGSTAPSVDYVCTSATSTLTVSASSRTTLVVSPQSTSCTGPGESTSGGGSSRAVSSGGGGGGTTVAVATPAPTASLTTAAQIQAQIEALRAQLTALQAAGTPAPSPSAAKGLITASLASGSRGPGVKALQQFLNAQGFTIASSGPGSPGNETEAFGSLTRAAVQKFQEKYNIAKPGIPGYGTVGPKTRAKINELSAQ